MDEPAVHQTPRSQDEEQLKLLAIFYFIVGGLTLMFACFPIFHVALGIAIIIHPEGFGGHANTNPAFDEIVGYMFVVMGSMFILTGWALGMAMIYSGRMIRRHRRRTFSLVVAGLACIFFPFGTALGVFTFVVLLRPGVAALYGE